MPTSIIKQQSAQQSCNHSSTCLAKGICRHLSEKNQAPQYSGVLRDETYIYRQNDPFTMVNVVHSGAVKTFYLNEDGDEQITGFYFPGQIFGLSGLSGGYYMDSAQALVTSSICQFDYEPMTRAFTSNPNLQHQFIEMLGKVILKEQLHQSTLCQKRAEGRLATFILGLTTYYTSKNMSSSEFIMPMSRRDIANHLGMALETVSRVLTTMEKFNILRVNRKEIKVIDKKALQQISHGEALLHPKVDKSTNPVPLAKAV